MAESNAVQASDGWTGTLAPSLRCDYCGVEVVGSDAPSLDSAKEAHRENCPERTAAQGHECPRCESIEHTGPCFAPPRQSASAAQGGERKVYWLLNRRWLGWKVHILHGFCAWEVQLGPHVLQWFYRDSGFRERNGGAFRHWIDSFGGRHAA